MSELRNTGVIKIDTSENTYLFNNFTKTKSTAGWTLDGTLNSDGVAILIGTAPTIQTTSFPIGTNEILVFECTVSVPIPSTTGGAGLYLGTLYGVSTDTYYWNFSTNSWSYGFTNDNPYFFYGYNSPTEMIIKSYILGSNISPSEIPPAECTRLDITVMALRVPNTTTCLRSGYNANTEMEIHFSNPKIYKINRMGLSEESNDTKIGIGWLNTNQIIEY